MYILHCNLESIEEASFSHLHFLGEALYQVLVDNAVRCGKEGQHVLDEMSLTVF